MRPVTLTDVARRPAPGTVTPNSVTFLPDGDVALALLAPEGSLEQELVAIDTATGDVRSIPTPGQRVDESELSLADRLRRERARQLTVGVTSFQVSGGLIMVPMADGLWLYDDIDAEPRLVVAAADYPGGIGDPRLCGDVNKVAFVSDDEVWVADIPPDAGPAVAVTTGAHERGVTHGLAEFVAAEEMGRSRGFWLSGDGTRLAFCEVDERHIPRYPIAHVGSEVVGSFEEHAYPFAGADNAVVRVGVVAADGSGAGDPVWLDLGCTGIGEDRYVARVAWAADGTIAVQVSDRAQRRVDLIAFDPDTGAGRLVLTETSDVWVNLHDNLRFLPDGEFAWTSERTGFRHIEVWDWASGERSRTLTEGGWVVTGIDAVDDTHVWFTSTMLSPLDRNLCRVPLAGGPVEVVNHSPGVHRSVVHAATGTVIDTHWTLDHPPVTVAFRTTTNGATDRAEGNGPDDLGAPSERGPDAGPGDSASPGGASPRSTVHHAGGETVDQLSLRTPELIEVTAADGSTTLHGAVFAPAGEGPHPTIVWVYGGPHAQLVTRSWALTAAMRAQFLRQSGYCVAVVDGRGSTDRGLAFEGELNRRMGTVEVDDQVALVEHLVATGITDRDRVGIYGWSYGGYMSAMCLARRPDVFAAACAGAPVTTWELYDTHYTERYMGTPADNAVGYQDGAVMTHVDGIAEGKLMLIHGLIDENVLFAHTARLASALNRADIGYELLVYPEERHTPRREEDRAAMERRIVDFFDRTL